MPVDEPDRSPTSKETGLGAVVLQAVDKAVVARWDRAKRVAAATSGTDAERVATLRTRFVREASGAGAAVGAAAAAPGAGLFTFLGTTAAELGWFTLRASDLILTIGAVHGHTDARVEERRAWVLSVLAFGDSAHDDLAALAGAVGQGLGKRAGASVPTRMLSLANRAMARTVLRRYGTRRGVLTFGRALPFGIGAVVGGTTNYALASQIARQAEDFFSER